MSERIVTKNEAVRVSSDDVCIVKPENEFFYQQCCDCGLTRRVELSPRTEELRMRFINVGKEFPFSEFKPVTTVIFAEKE